MFVGYVLVTGCAQACERATALVDFFPVSLSVTCMPYPLGNAMQGGFYFAPSNYLQG